MKKSTGFDGTRLRSLRENSHPTMSRDALGQALHVTAGTIANWELGRSKPDDEAINGLAEIFHVSTDYLLGRTPRPQEHAAAPQPSTPSLPAGAIPLGPLVSLPLYEEITGDPIAMQQTPDGFAVVDTNLVRGDLDSYFWLRVKDDSMIGNALPAGARVLVHRGTDIRDGDIAVIAVNDTVAVIRKVQHAGNMLVLMPMNPAYETQTISREEATVIGWVEGAFTPLQRPGA